MNNENSSRERRQGQSVIHRRSTIYNLFILVLIVFSLVVMAGLIFGPGTNQVIHRVDVLVCAVLFADFLRSLWRAPSRSGYFFRGGGWLDLLGSIPAVPGLPLSSLLHLARLNQLVRIVKHLRGKDRDEMIEETRQAPAKTALLTITIAAFVLITIASLLILRLERGATGATIKTGADAFWWAMVTVTSVGYGDYVPVTFPGRILAIVLMVFGIGVFAVLTSFVATRLVGLRHDQEEMVEFIREENTIIREELAELKELLKQQGAMDGDGG
ncbi:potassium channel family protein [Chloroflexota bacterium]